VLISVWDGEDVPTATQRKFKKKMDEIHTSIRKNKSEKIYSYIQDQYISSYYQRAQGNPRRKIKILSVAKYCFLIATTLFGLVFYTAAPYSKITAVPFTLMIASIILLLFGLIHPSLAFMDGKSRLG
jgi:hypothetical protein